MSSNFNMLDSFNLLLSRLRDNLSAKRTELSPGKIEGGVGVYLLYEKKYGTPPLDISTATLRSALSLTPRPYPRKTQALATSLALAITQNQPKSSLPVGFDPLLAQASPLESRLDKALRKAHSDAHFLLTQVGYRVVDISDATENLALSSLRLYRVLREYEGV